jgi:hypothetical protein
MTDQTPMLLTQDHIDAAIDPATMQLYYTLHDAGAVPADESRGTQAPYTEAIDALLAATKDDPALHPLTQVLDDVAFDFAMTMFGEGFRRGVAFTRWLAARPDPTMVPQIAT